MLVLILQFTGLALVIVGAGYKLTLVGDKLADETGFGENVVGFVLLAAVTSMPELSTALTAAKLGEQGLVFGNMIGSNIFNMVVIALILLFPFKKHINNTASEKNIFSASLGIYFAAILGLFIMLEYAHSGLMLIIVYVVLMVLSYKFEKKGSLDEIAPSFKFKILYKDYLLFLFLSIIVVFSGYFMTGICDKIAITPFSLFEEEYLLGATFVGQMFLAVATSLPELIVSFSAAKIGKINMAYSNIFGSNIFNLAILGISGVVYDGNMFLNAKAFLFSLMIFIMFVAVIISSLQYKTKRRIRFDSLFIIGMYIFNLYISFIQK